MSEDGKRSHRITEITGNFLRRMTVNKIGSNRFVNAVFGSPRLDEEFATLD